MKLPDHLSVSQLNTFLSCPLAYRFRYVDRIETGTKSSSFALGTAFHSAAERLHKDIIAGHAGAADDYCTAFDDALSVEFGCFDVQLKAGESADSLHQEGRALVELYREHRLRQPAKLVDAELRIEQRLVNPATREELGVPFVAYLDLVERDSGGAVYRDTPSSCGASVRPPRNAFGRHWQQSVGSGKEGRGICDDHRALAIPQVTQARPRRAATAHVGRRQSGETERRQ